MFRQVYSNCYRYLSFPIPIHPCRVRETPSEAFVLVNDTQLSHFTSKPCTLTSKASPAVFAGRAAMADTSRLHTAGS